MKLDTVSLSLHTDYIINHNKTNYNHSQIRKPNGAVIDNYSLVTKSFGFESVCVNETYDYANLKFNSKILKDNYYKGICLETLDQIIDEIENHGLKLDPAFLDDSNIKMVHITDDISVLQHPAIYINALNNLIAPKFYKTVYDEGITFNEAIKNEKLYITVYGKEYQIKQDRRFFKAYPRQIDYFKNKLRVETKLSTRKTIHKHLDSYTLPEILASDSPNAHFLDKVIENQLSFPSIFSCGNISCTEEKNLIYSKYLFDLYNGNRKAIVKHIKNRLSIGTNPTYQLKQLDSYLAIIANSEDLFLKDNLNELRSKLLIVDRVAA
ncbi:hypothetical protein [uncultured Christiangramia sp.]|uniref:hypothetical protein n=1 Tax=uncultured Christiangramia sp. TaxID=503836 RepID=UPI0026077AFA|nr:hypothetical protein [uncultured Christiangramia sp.]